MSINEWKNKLVIKQLIWESPCKENNYVYNSKTDFGTYYIHICGGRHEAWLEAGVEPYERFFSEGYVGSIEEAKAQAQEYHEKLIKQYFGGIDAE